MFCNPVFYLFCIIFVVIALAYLSLFSKREREESSGERECLADEVNRTDSLTISKWSGLMFDIAAEFLEKQRANRDLDTFVYVIPTPINEEDKSDIAKFFQTSDWKIEFFDETRIVLVRRH